MITITKIVNIDSPSGLYTFTWNNTGNECVSFSPSTGTTIGSISTQVSFSNESCLSTASISITITDSDGCSTTIPVVFPNTCDDFTVSSITQQPNYIFSVSASSPYCTDFTYQWIYDTSLFANGGGISNSSGSTIDLNPVGITFPTSTEIACIVQDCYGCQKTVFKTVVFVKPNVANETTVLHEVEDGFISGTIALENDVNYTGTIDWDTIQFSLPNGFSIERTDNEITISATSAVTQGAYAIYFTVKDIDGITSNQETLTVQVIPSTFQTIQVLDIVAQRECSAIVTDELIIYIDDKIIINPADGNEIDWTTFAFLTTPTPTSSTISLEIDLDGNRYISYEIPATTGVDVFKYTVCDTNGSCASTGTVTVQLVCNSTPAITVKSACVACGDSVDIDITTGSTTSVAWQLNSTAIVSSPTKGTVQVNPDGTVTYTPTTGNIGTDTFTYNLTNADGYTSNTTTATIDILCAGENTIHLACN